MTAKPHGRALTVADGGAAKLIRQRRAFASGCEEKLSQSVPREDTNWPIGGAPGTGEVLRDTGAHLQVAASLNKVIRADLQFPIMQRNVS